MAALYTKPRVLIIGAGLGGLALAQSLRKQNIPFDIFERDVSNESRSQGWAITLHAWMIDEFKASMPEDMPDLATVDHLYEHNISCEAAVFNTSGEELKEIKRFGPDHGHHMIRANRGKLRTWLLTKINTYWNKRFSHFEQDEQGVTAFFEDGSSYQGDILVGADGLQSRVRNQLLPDNNSRPRNVALGSILGEVTATKEQYQRWMKLATSYFTGFSDDKRVSVALKAISADRETAEYYWLFGWNDEEALREDYWTALATAGQLHNYVMNNLEGVHSSFAEILLATPAAGMMLPPLRLRDMTPPELPTGRITLVGDSVHPMVPFRGQGGNMAIIDALSLAKTLKDTESGDVSGALKQYESEMSPRSKKAVLDSRAAIREENVPRQYSTGSM